MDVFFSRMVLMAERESVWAAGGRGGEGEREGGGGSPVSWDKDLPCCQSVCASVWRRWVCGQQQRRDSSLHQSDRRCPLSTTAVTLLIKSTKLWSESTAPGVWTAGFNPLLGGNHQRFVPIYLDILGTRMMWRPSPMWCHWLRAFWISILTAPPVARAAPTIGDPPVARQVRAEKHTAGRGCRRDPDLWHTVVRRYGSLVALLFHFLFFFFYLFPWDSSLLYMLLAQRVQSFEMKETDRRNA